MIRQISVIVIVITCFIATTGKMFGVLVFRGVMPAMCDVMIKKYNIKVLLIPITNNRSKLLHLFKCINIVITTVCLCLEYQPI